MIWKIFFLFDWIPTFSHIGLFYPQFSCKEPCQIFPKWPQIIAFITTINMSYILLMESKVKPIVSSTQECFLKCPYIFDFVEMILKLCSSLQIKFYFSLVIWTQSIPHQSINFRLEILNFSFISQPPVGWFSKAR